MRIDTYGKQRHLKQELLDIIADSLPECPENEDFSHPRSYAFMTLGDDLINKIKEHLQEVTE